MCDRSLWGWLQARLSIFFLSGFYWDILIEIHQQRELHFLSSLHCLLMSVVWLILFILEHITCFWLVRESCSCESVLIRTTPSVLFQLPLVLQLYLHCVRGRKESKSKCKLKGKKNNNKGELIFHAFFSFLPSPLIYHHILVFYYFSELQSLVATSAEALRQK